MRLTPIITRASVAGVESPRPHWISPAAARRLDPLTQLSAAAVAGLGATAWDPGTAIVLGSAWGSVASSLGFAEDMRTYGDGAASPAAFTTSVHHHPCGSLCQLLGIHGPSLTISLGGRSGLAALRAGLSLVAAGRAPAAVVIAADRTTPWLTTLVSTLAVPPAPPGGGAVALWITADGPGWRMGADDPDLPTIDAGGASSAEEARWSRTRDRLRACDRFATWWPTAALAAVPWDHPTGPVRVREGEAGMDDAMVLEPVR